MQIAQTYIAPMANYQHRNVVVLQQDRWRPEVDA